MHKTQKQGIVILIGFFGIFFLGGWFILNSYPVEALVGSFMSMVDPQRHDHVYAELEKKNDTKLFRLLWSGDSAKHSAATMVLAKRNKKNWFDKYQKLLNDKRYEVRLSARGLLSSASDDQSRVYKILLQEIQRYEPMDDDYQQIMRMLVKSKYEPVYPYVRKYALLPNGWRNASCKYLKELGNPDALDILYEQKKIAEAEVWKKTSISKSEQKSINQVVGTIEPTKLSIIDELAIERLDEAIATLESIKKQQETNQQDKSTDEAK